jgi:hypothetical protein
MSDTTWSVLRQYVTAFLVVVSRNTAIPLAFAFGRSETCELYDISHGIFQDRFHVDLSLFTLESDQGSGLGKYARSHAFKHRYCPRHFLVTLKDRVFGVFVHFLVKTGTSEQFEILREIYRSQVHDAINRLPETGLKRAQQEFGKAGLQVIYRDEQLPVIEIIDEERWQKVASMHKYHELLPTTTNCLESLNGHQNARTPRRNSFWGSLHRLATMIGHGINFFTPSVRHNFNSASRRAMTAMRSIGEIEMNLQIVQYQTDAQNRTCNCGLFWYFTRMYRTFLPCCHLLHCGVPRSKMCDPPVLLKGNDPDSFELILEQNSRPGEEPSLERRDALIDMAAWSIKRLSHTGVRIDKIMEWVTENFPPQKDMVLFVQNIPVQVLTLISHGVMNFGGLPD